VTARGVDQTLGDRCSALAARWARSTASAKSPRDDDAFAHFVHIDGISIAISSDGIGTKIEVAERTGRYDLLGYDLLAMVIDDLAAIGAIPLAVSNILDVDRLDEPTIDALFSGLAKAAIDTHVTLSGGEIAQLGDRVAGYGDGMHFQWSATGIGRLVGFGSPDREGTKTWRDAVIAGDRVVALASDGFRSNGFTLARDILVAAHGEVWHEATTHTDRTWGDVLLTPSRLYAPAIVDLLDAGTAIHGAVHVTGGGLPGNLARLLAGTGLGAHLHQLWPPHAEMIELIELGGIDPRDAFGQWNMGTGMLLILPPASVDSAIEQLARVGVRAREAGEIVESSSIALHTEAFGALTVPLQDDDG